ncbi:MAG: hypothetical protein AAF614_17990 [Chloroflexota bacterium]
MTTLSPFHNTLLGYQGQLYLLTYWSTLRRVLGIPLSRLVKGIPILLAFAALLWVGSLPLFYLFAGLALFIQLGYWYAKRQSYNTFVADPISLPADDALESLPANRRIPLSATGIFSLNDREESVLLAKAEYWYVPLGEHIIMVEQVKDHYLYQFFNAKTIQKVEHGWLVFGKTPHRSLALTFQLNWGPEFADGGALYFVRGDEKAPRARQRTVYFSFENEGDLTAVYHTIIHDARLLRQQQ